MYDKRSERDAIRYGILDRMQSLENELMQINDIVNVEFDIRDFDELHQVILIPKYNIKADRNDYFEARKTQIGHILTVCMDHDLHASGDTIEDMGEHWYIVRSCGKSWREQS